MGLWDEVKKAAKDPQAERIKAREQDRHGALLVVRQTNVEVRPKRLLIFEDRVEMHDPGFLKTEIKSMRYSRIAGVRLEGRMIRGDLVVESTGGDRIFVPKLPKGEARQAVEIIQRKMAERDAGHAPSPVRPLQTSPSRSANSPSFASPAYSPRRSSRPRRRNCFRGSERPKVSRKTVLLALDANIVTR